MLTDILYVPMVLSAVSQTALGESCSAACVCGRGVIMTDTRGSVYAVNLLNRSGGLLINMKAMGRF